MEEFENIYIENDKISAPFLLAASFNGLVSFMGSFIKNGVLYWKFSPKEKCFNLLDQLRTKTEPHIPSKDLFEATDTWWEQVYKARNGEIKNGDYR